MTGVRSTGAGAGGMGGGGAVVVCSTASVARCSMSRARRKCSLMQGSRSIGSLNMLFQPAYQREISA
ncbi:hypothetical protein ACLKA6_000075 [Drosophila palustris]